MSKFYSSTIQKGSTGDDVKKWQTFLNSMGGQQIAVDGIFGDETLSLTKDYQLMNGLDADGIVGENTWSKAGYKYQGVNTSTGSGSSSPTAPTAPTFNTTATATPTLDPLPTAPTYDSTKWDDTSKGQAALGSYNSAKDAVNNYGDFTYEDYVKSQDVIKAENALNVHLANKPGAYQSQWQDQLDALMSQIMNRKKFSYNMNEDALYQQYKDKYIQQGKLAMGDTMGQAAAMTGGYGNSYAQSVGQQAYQNSLDNLNDVVPELYAMALDRYNQEGQDLYNQYGLVADREDQDYGRYRDTVADWQTDRGYLTDKYYSERDFDYGKYVDDRNMDYTLHQDGYQKLLDKLGIAKDDYYSGADMHYTEQSNQNSIANQQFNDAMSIWGAESDEAWKRYQAEEEARQYGNSLSQQEYENAYGVYRDQVTDEQWQKQYDESVRQYDNQMALEWAQYEESIRQYNDTMAFNKAQAKKTSGGSSSGNTGNTGNNQQVQNPEQTPVEETKDMYANWDGLDWEQYFSSIRQEEGQSAAEAELDRMNKAGLIPKSFVTYASSGARGGQMGH